MPDSSLSRILTICTFGAIAVALSQACVVDENDPVVITESGIIQGTIQESLGKNISAFLGIPFATPPVGDMRFRKPVPVRPWEGVYAAKKFPPACFQPGKVVLPGEPFSERSSEDCLYLNVWSPLPVANKTLRPVLVWIYGGSFKRGSSDYFRYNGQAISSFGDVVVVSFNYRLGVLGFLNADIPDAPGNQGMYDQALALKWIKSNIRYFGGDPDNITLFGLSAGGISVGMHLLSPLSNHLFKRAFLMSGTPNMVSFLDDPSASVALADKFADRAGCLFGNHTIVSHPKEVVRCLRGMYGNELIEIQESISRGVDSIFLPRYDDEFLPKNPHLMLREGNVGPVKEVLVGTVADEGSTFLVSSFPRYFSPSGETPINLTLEQTKLLFREFFKVIPGLNSGFISDNLLYNIDPEDSEALRKALIDAVGDFIILCPAVFFSEMMSDHNASVYLYHMTYRSPTYRYSEWLGVFHSSDIPYVFGVPLRIPEAYTPEDVEMSKRMMDMFVTFAKTGSPPPQLNVTWPLYTSEEQEHMELHAERASVLRGGPHKDNCNFWRIIFDFAV